MEKKSYPCETCSMRKKAEANPKSLMSRIWKWHTSWCPGWKEYQKSLDLLKELQIQFPNDPGLKQRVDVVQAQLAAASKTPQDTVVSR